MSLLFRLSKPFISNPVVSRNLLQRAATTNTCGHMLQYVAICEGGSHQHQYQPRVFMSQQSNQHPAENVQSYPIYFQGKGSTDSLSKETSLTQTQAKTDGQVVEVLKNDLGPQVDIATNKALGAAHSQWAAVPQKIQVGSVLPFSDLNFLQILIFPYTYAIMYYLDFILNYLPWWQAIIVTTATARLIFFPLVIKQNIIGIKTYNILPESQRIQQKVNEALSAGDTYNVALGRSKMQILNKQHGLTMKDRLLPILIQAPVYMSMFFLLRNLTGIPAEGLATGGALWFTDLTVPDPYYILPIITSTSMFLLFEFGMEGGMNPRQGMAPIGRYMLRSIPLIMLAFIHNFPAALLLFWSTSNIFTLSYALILKNRWVKKKLNIPKRIEHDQASLPMANQTFKGQLKDAIEKGKVKRTTMDVRRLDDIAFRKAGVGPLRKTYKQPPS